MIIKAATLDLLARAQNLDTVQSSGHLRLLLNRNVVMILITEILESREDCNNVTYCPRCLEKEKLSLIPVSSHDPYSVTLISGSTSVSSLFRRFLLTLGPFFERIFILSGPRGTRQKNSEMRPSAIKRQAQGSP